MSERITLQAGALSVDATLDGGRLCAVDLPEEIPAALDGAMLEQMIAQLENYEISWCAGGAFRRTVWERLRRIPMGSAMTYGELARELGNPRAMRAVGQACATNPLLLVVPCHRVLAAEGMGGFARGLEWKRKLLELESERAGRS